MHDQVVTIEYISVVKNAKERGPEAEPSSQDDEKRRVSFGRDQPLYTKAGGREQTGFGRESPDNVDRKDSRSLRSNQLAGCLKRSTEKEQSRLQSEW